MKYLVTLLCVCFLTSLGTAQQRVVSEEQVRIQMQLNKQKWLAQQQNKKLSYNDAYDLAWENNRPLFIWVNTENEKLEKAFPNGVHVHLSEYKDIENSGLVIGIRRDGKFQRFDLFYIDENSIQAILTPPVSKAVPQNFVPQSVFAQSFENFERFSPQSFVPQSVSPQRFISGSRNC